jgi:hypothetical protein
MNPRIKPIKLKVFAAILIDAFLFLLLLVAGYAFFFVPARAENVDWPTNTAIGNKTSNTDLNATDDRVECPTNTSEPSATNTLEPSPTSTIEPSETSTLEPPPTSTIEPSATNTPEPSSTFTLEPSATNTPEPSSTFTLEPSATNTSEPSSTFTLEPSATNTLEPSPTSTIKPSSTNTLVQPSPTNTPKPSASSTFKPTSTRTSTTTPRRTPSPTSTPPPKTVTPSPTSKLFTPTPSTTSTLVVNTCTECYLVKDFRELIVRGLYNADLLNTEDISSTFKVSITLYDVYKGIVVGKAIDMVDTQPTNEVMHVQTPLWCITPTTGDVYWIHTEASAQKTTGEIWFVLDEWVRINLSGDITKLP